MDHEEHLRSKARAAHDTRPEERDQLKWEYLQAEWAIDEIDRLRAERDTAKIEVLEELVRLLHEDAAPLMKRFPGNPIQPQVRWRISHMLAELKGETLVEEDWR